VIPSVSSGDLRYSGETGTLPDVIARNGDWSKHEAYVVGPSEMVQDTVARLKGSGMAQDQIHIEDFGWSES